jgi:hypothetical protein
MRDAYAAARSSQRQPCRRWARSGAWLVVSPAARSTERSVTRGVTDPTLQPLQDQDRCVLGMRPVRGISDRASLKPQSKDRSLCVRRRVVSQAGKLTRAYLRNAGTYWSYERALLYRIPSWSSACHSRDKKSAASTLPVTGGWSSSTPSLSRTESEWRPTQAEIHPLAKTDWRLKQHNNNGSQRMSFISASGKIQWQCVTRVIMMTHVKSKS